MKDLVNQHIQIPVITYMHLRNLIRKNYDLSVRVQHTLKLSERYFLLFLVHWHLYENHINANVSKKHISALDVCAQFRKLNKIKRCHSVYNWTVNSTLNREFPKWLNGVWNYFNWKSPLTNLIFKFENLASE